MNETGMSGEDLCEQPVLTWIELRALAGLAVGAIILVASGRLGLLNPGGVAPQAASAAIPEITIPIVATSTDTEVAVPTFTHPDITTPPKILELTD